MSIYECVNSWGAQKLTGDNLKLVCVDFSTLSLIAVFLSVITLGSCDKFYFNFEFEFKCEFEFTKNLRRTKYLFAIYQTSQISIQINPNIYQIRLNINEFYHFSEKLRSNY
jgi:hypothetical protein